jgi:hypothetical protein
MTQQKKGAPWMERTCNLAPKSYHTDPTLQSQSAARCRWRRPLDACHIPRTKYEHGQAWRASSEKRRMEKSYAPARPG